MGEKLVREALEYVRTPDALTTPERMELVRLATMADDETRALPSIVGTVDDQDEDDERANWQGALEEKGALEWRGNTMYFTQMTLSDAYKAYQVMSGVDAHREDPAQAYREFHGLNP